MYTSNKKSSSSTYKAVRGVLLVIFFLGPCALVIAHLSLLVPHEISQEAICTIKNSTVDKVCYTLDVLCKNDKGVFSGKIIVPSNEDATYKIGHLIPVQYTNCPSSSCKLSYNIIESKPKHFLNMVIFNALLVVWIGSWFALGLWLCMNYCYKDDGYRGLS